MKVLRLWYLQYLHHLVLDYHLLHNHILLLLLVPAVKLIVFLDHFQMRIFLITFCVVVVVVVGAALPTARGLGPLLRNGELLTGNGACLTGSIASSAYSSSFWANIKEIDATKYTVVIRNLKQIERIIIYKSLVYKRTLVIEYYPFATI